ncbi:hypothetical protein FPHOBKDP_00125 [Listeria phage LPJP1]|nr:hypothetical protein FPHOBKDP_00125 [Listeria phage LPJP1]
MYNGNYDISLYEYLKSKLKVCYITSKKDETVIRCPFCGDSAKNQYSAHLYINNKPPYKYYCQKCNSNGIFNDKILNNLNIFDAKLNQQLKVSYEKFIKDAGIKYGKSFSSLFNMDETDILPNNFGMLELRKIKYYEDRLGIKLNDELLIKYRIILNLSDYMENNKIPIKQDKWYIEKLKMINDNYIIFLSNDKNVINCRNITNVTEKKKRHIKMRLFEDFTDESRSFYSIKNNISLDKSLYNIHLTEGISDIISVHHNIFKDQENNNDIFISSNGKGYNSVLQYLLSIGITNANINIYGDSDVNRNYYNRLKYNLLAKYNGVNLYFNIAKDPYGNGFKDFGVRSENVELSKSIKISF